MTITYRNYLTCCLTVRKVIGRSRQYGLVCGLAVMLTGMVACGDLVGNATLPAGTERPETYNTTAGARGVYLGAKAQTNSGLASAILDAGALTDELTSEGLGSSPQSIGATGDPVDERLLPDGVTGNAGDRSYSTLQKVRGYALEAIGLLQTYDTTRASPALQGEMYALEGYAELLLAELYCSGVPLSTLDFQKDFTYQPSSTTEQVYRHASVLFDTAMALARDSANIESLAQVGKGRALLDLGEYEQAAEIVATVPDTFRYQFSHNFGIGQGYEFARWTIASREGVNGLPFSTSDDPRTQVISRGPNQFGVPQFEPAQYPIETAAPIVLANGIEARLIQAEAELHSGDAAWLTTLNTLRTTCQTTSTCPTPAPAGTGGIDGLPPLSDPGSDSARVTLLFTERANWLFLTAHRQGDLRRLVSQYGRPQNTVYPTGLYFGGQGSYGTDVTLPIPSSERVNPLFHGCIDRGA
jgi:hypothetical protein